MDLPCIFKYHFQKFLKFEIVKFLLYLDYIKQFLTLLFFFDKQAHILKKA